MEAVTMQAEPGPNGSSWNGAPAVDRVRSGIPEIVRAYTLDGFALVKNVFKLDEVMEMRRRCARVFEKTGGKIGDAASYPEIRDALLDERILTILRAVLGDELVYFGDSTIYANSRFDRHIHNDARGDTDDPSRSDYGILRMGIYLQDHAFHSNGLKVRPGSHRRVFWTARNALRLVGVGGERLSPRAFRPSWFHNVPSEPGDLVFWNLRTHHAGHAVRLRMFDRLALPPGVEHLVPARLARPMPRDRYAIFCSWGRSSPELERYIKELGYHPDYRGMWQRSTFGAGDVRDAFERRNVQVRDDVLRLVELGA